MAPALAACALGVSAAGQATGQPDFEVRPIYYAMLAAVESSFAAHSERMEETYRSSREAIEGRALEELGRLEAQGEAIERARREGEAAFETARTAQNARIEAVNEAVEGLETRRPGSAAVVERYREAYEQVLALLREAQSRYREQNADVQAGREAVAAAARAYRDGSSEDAREIAQLDTAYRRFAARTWESFHEREAALRRDLESFRSGLHEQRRPFEHAERALVALAERYRVLREHHDRVQRELNRNIEAYNERVRAAGNDDSDDSDDSRLDERAALRDDIAILQERLDAHRERAVLLFREFESRRGALETEIEAFEAQRREGEEELRRRAETLLSEQRDIAALVASRRAGVQTRITMIEDRVRTRFRVLRAEVEAAAQQLEEEFVAAPLDLFAAVAEWAQSLDPSHLYDSEGTPRFDPSPPRSRALFAAVDAMRGLEREARSAFAFAGQLRAVQRQRAEIARDRQDLVEHQSAFAAEYEARRSRWEGDLGAAKEASGRLDGALTRYFERAFALAGYEVQTVQSALLDALDTPPETRPEAAVRAHLLASLAEVRAELEERLGSPAPPAGSLVEGLAATGSQRSPEAPDIEWRHPDAASSPEESASEEDVLEGESKRRLLAAWYPRLRATGSLDPLAETLSSSFPSHSAADLDDALYGLFETGLLDASEIVRHQWADGSRNYRVQILDRSYWLRPDGRLLLAR